MTFTLKQKVGSSFIVKITLQMQISMLHKKHTCLWKKGLLPKGQVYPLLCLINRVKHAFSLLNLALQDLALLMCSSASYVVCVKGKGTVKTYLGVALGSFTLCEERGRTGVQKWKLEGGWRVGLGKWLSTKPKKATRGQWNTKGCESS